MKNISHKLIILLAINVALTIVILGGDGQCLRHNQNGYPPASDNHSTEDCPDNYSSQNNNKEEFYLEVFDISLINNIKQYLENILNL